MNFQLINRRLHLYLALFLLPWVVMYGVSSVPFNHSRTMDEWFGRGVDFTTVFERRYDRPAPASDEDLREFGAAVLREAGMSGAFGVYREDPGRVVVYRFDFGSSHRLTYDVTGGTLKAEEHRMKPHHYLTSMHARGGFQQESPLNDAWAVVVDLVCLAMIVWVASGLIMWWPLRRHRGWGLAALAAGAVSFALLVVKL